MTDKNAKRIKHDGRQLSDYPLGTKAMAYNGGFWERTTRGWRWCGGDTFPRPGGDWLGDLLLPCEAALAVMGGGE